MRYDLNRISFAGRRAARPPRLLQSVLPVPAPTQVPFGIYPLQTHATQVKEKGELTRMEIKKSAMAGTLESSDCMVTVEPGDGKVEFSLDSSVINQYGNQIRKVALQTLKNLGIDNVRLSIVDKGALDCTIRARIEGAVYRAVDQYENLPWGGAIQP